MSENEIQNLINKIFEKMELDSKDENMRKQIQAGDKFAMMAVHGAKFDINCKLADKLKEFGPSIITPILTHLGELKKKKQLVQYLAENNFYGSPVYRAIETIVELKNLEKSITPEQMKVIHKMLGWKELYATKDRSALYQTMNIARDAGDDKTITVLLNIIVRNASNLSKDSLQFIVNVIKDIRRRLKRRMKSSR